MRQLGVIVLARRKGIDGITYSAVLVQMIANALEKRALAIDIT